MFKQLNFDRQADGGGVTAPAVVQTNLSPLHKKGADHCGRRPFLLDAIKPSAYLLTWPARTAAFLRSVALSRRLRRRMFLGVISTSSSSAMYSRASSSEKVRGGTS